MILAQATFDRWGRLSEGCSALWALEAGVEARSIRIRRARVRIEVDSTWIAEPTNAPMAQWARIASRARLIGLVFARSTLHAAGLSCQ